MGLTVTLDNYRSLAFVLGGPSGLYASTDNDPATGTDYLKKKLKTLKDPDYTLIDEYAGAYVLRNEKRNYYVIKKTELIKKIGDLYLKHEALPLGSHDRLMIKANLLDYGSIIRGSGIKLSEIRPITANNAIGSLRPDPSNKACQMSDILQGDTEIFPNELPAEMAEILEKIKMEDGTSYLKYIKDNVNTMVFTRQMTKIALSMKPNEIGTAEELTRTIFIDTFDERYGKLRAAWSLCATAVTSAGHIEVYNKFNGDKEKLYYEFDERFAATREYAFLRSLLASGIVPQEERSHIAWELSGVEEKINGLNVLLGYPKGDFSVKTK